MTNPAIATDKSILHKLKTLGTLFPTTWLVIWLWIFLANFVLGIFIPSSTILMLIRLGGILLCLIYAIRAFPNDHLLHIALLLTFTADVFLAYSPAGEIGLCVFLLAQFVHTIRLRYHRNIIPFIGFGGIIILVLLIDFFLNLIPIIYLICGFYLMMLLTNIYLSYQWHLHSSNDIHATMALIGFILFLSCDTCTAVSYLSTNGILISSLHILADFLAWFFYYPAQVFIANSSKSTKTRENVLK